MKVEFPVVPSPSCESLMEVMGKEQTVQTCNGNIWGGPDDTESLEPLHNVEAFLPADGNCPLIFEETKLPLLEDLIMT